MHDEPREVLDSAIEELDALIRQRLPDPELDRLLFDDLGMGYWPPGEGMSLSTFLVRLRDELITRAGSLRP